MGAQGQLLAGAEGQAAVSRRQVDRPKGISRHGSRTAGSKGHLGSGGFRGQGQRGSWDSGPWMMGRVC